MLDKVKLMLGIETAVQDAVLQLMIDDAKAAVRDYCNRKDFPEPLEYIVRELVADAYNAENGGNVASVKRGDTQINYTTVITKSAFTDRQRSAMNRYKKIRMD